MPKIELWIMILLVDFHKIRKTHLIEILFYKLMLTEKQSHKMIKTKGRRLVANIF